MQSQGRQSVAREQQVAQRRGAEGDSSDEDVTVPGNELPKVDLRQLISSHSAMESDGDGIDFSKILKDILGVVINMYAKTDDIEKVKKASDENRYRIAQLEAKVGKPEDIALPLGLAVRYLPLPQEGISELDNVKMAFREINAPGVDVNKDVVKAIRVGYKAESEPGARNAYLGTVKVEMRTEEGRAAVMKNKFTLKNHPKEVMKTLVVQNLKSREEMKYENFNYDILKMVTNSTDFYIGGNGHIRKKEQNNYPLRPLAPRPPPRMQYGQQPPRYQSQPAPTHNQFQVPPPVQKQYHAHPPPPAHSQFQGAQGLSQQLGPSHQQQDSLLDTDSIFSFDPIQLNNPYKAPAVNASQTVTAQFVPPNGINEARGEQMQAGPLHGVHVTGGGGRQQEHPAQGIQGE